MATAPIEPEFRSVIAASAVVPLRLKGLAQSPESRTVLEQFVAAAIDLLDFLDGNPDEEPTGDELDGNGAEDDFCSHNLPMPGPGCPLADPDTGIEDEPHDGIAEDLEEEEPDIPAYGCDQTKGPLPPQPATDLAIMQPHIDRIRRTRCDARTIRPWGAPEFVEYRLRESGDRPQPRA